MWWKSQVEARRFLWLVHKNHTYLKNHTCQNNLSTFQPKFRNNFFFQRLSNSGIRKKIADTRIF